MGILTDGPAGLFSRFNKSKGKSNDEITEGVITSDNLLDLDKPDTDLISQARAWTAKYDNSSTAGRIKKDGDTNERYWRGRQFPDTEYDNGKRPLTDNIIFEALETFLPLATQKAPEPVVETDDSPEMEVVKDKIYMSLMYIGRVNHIKTKIKKGVRFWANRYVGAWKIGWDSEKNEISIIVVKPQNLIFDTDYGIDDGEYMGEYLGEKMEGIASDLITRFPDKKDDITKLCGEKLGSLMGYTQWWTKEALFYTMAGVVLGKYKNPNWNYDETKTITDADGNVSEKLVAGQNHFPHPQIPYAFLTVFDLGDEPCDKTSLIEQGLVTQDNINKRLKQIDRNADNINGGIVVSGQYFSKEAAAQVAQARREGRTITVPTGKIEDAILFPANQALPEFVYQSLQDSRERFMARFGVAGTSSGSSDQEETVRGKIIAGDNDTSRIGGGITEYIEIAASRIFNHCVQMMYVYYDVPHEISIIGPGNTQQLFTFMASEIPPGRKIFVSVQDGSLVPQDDLSKYNQAQAMWESEALDPLSYFEMTQDKNPLERAQRLMLYKSNPALYSATYLKTPTPQTELPPQQQGSESGAPPNSVPTPPPEKTPIGQEEHQLIEKVPIK